MGAASSRFAKLLLFCLGRAALAGCGGGGSNTGMDSRDADLSTADVHFQSQQYNVLPPASQTVTATAHGANVYLALLGPANASLALPGEYAGAERTGRRARKSARRVADLQACRAKPC